MEQYFISMGVSVILMMLKDEQKKRQFRNIMLKVYRAIKQAFADDEDFQ